MVKQFPLGRKVAPDDNHIKSYPFSAVAPKTAITVNKVHKLPYWHWTHDQGHEGSCVGHGAGMERAITNGAQNFLAKLVHYSRRYDTIDIWNQAKIVDGDPSTNPGDDQGTYVRAAYDVLRTIGPRRVGRMELVNGIPIPINEKARDLKDGVSVTRWATSVDEVRTAIANGTPVTIGVNWYSDFDDPILAGKEYWIARSGIKGSVRGGHCVCIYGASDSLGAVRIKNSWGRGYPLVWLPYESLQRLINEDGEVALATDL